jgi:hypothetical protein
MSLKAELLLKFRQKFAYCGYIGGKVSQITQECSCASMIAYPSSRFIGQENARS